MEANLRFAAATCLVALLALDLSPGAAADYGGFYRIASPCAIGISSVTVNAQGTVALSCVGQNQLYLGQIPKPAL